MIAPRTSHITIAARPFLHSQKSALTNVNITYLYTMNIILFIFLP